jgi:hypothetical protein
MSRKELTRIRKEAGRSNSCCPAATVLGNRTLFAGGALPSSRISPIAQKIMSYVPLPNSAGDNTSSDSNNYISPANRNDTFPVFSTRVDQNWNNSQRSFITLNWNYLDEHAGNNFNGIATEAC